MKRLIIAFSLLGLALAGRFATLEVKPNGNSDLDVGTGIYTLPSGGTISDNRSKLSLTAKYIQYKDGEFIKAKEATYKALEGEFTAATLDYQYANDTLRLGQMRISSGELKGLSAQQGVLYKEDILVLRGQVRSSEPSLEANLLVVDSQKDLALVLGNFVYKQGNLSLKGQKADSTLLLNLAGGKVQASTKVAPEVLARLKPFAERP